MKTCNDIAPLLSAYFDGVLTESERSEVLAHLDECAACRARLAEYAAMQTELLAAFEEKDAPEGFTAGVMAAVRAEKAGKPQKAKKSAWRRFMPVAACAAIVLLTVSLFPQMSKMDNSTAAADTAAPMMTESDEQRVADTAFGTNGEAGDAAPDTELVDSSQSVQSSMYYEGHGDGAETIMAKSTEDDSGLVYFCEPREINGEEGLLLVEENGAVLLTLYGEGATAYVEENGGVPDGAGYYYLPVSALLALPEDITLKDVQAAELAELPEDAEWVIVCPDDCNEVPQA